MKCSITTTLFTTSLMLLVCAVPTVAQDYSYNSEMHALEFQTVSSGDITPTGASFAWTDFLGDKSALRYSLTLTTEIESQEYDQNETNSYPASADSKYSRFSGGVTFSPQWVYYPLAGDRVQLSTAIGPLLGYDWDYSNSRTEYLHITPSPGETNSVTNRDINDRTFRAGLSFTLGSQYFLAPRFALSAWYGMEAVMEVERSTSTLRTNYTPDTIADYRDSESDDWVRTSFRTSGGGIGLTFYY
ncbi:hypothetical protein KQI63_13955 [bacterium]|nr:hypothetical protein [bacterium]